MNAGKKPWYFIRICFMILNTVFKSKSYMFDGNVLRIKLDNILEKDLRTNEIQVLSWCTQWSVFDLLSIFVFFIHLTRLINVYLYPFVQPSVGTYKNIERIYSSIEIWCIICPGFFLHWKVTDWDFNTFLAIFQPFFEGYICS